MKKLLSVILGSLLISLMFVTSGSPAKAAELNPNQNPAALDCGCNVTIVTGAERNTIVASLISSDEFKTYKNLAMQMGYTWDGAGVIEVERNNSMGGAILEAVPFTGSNGQLFIIFVEGHYVGAFQQ